MHKHIIPILAVVLALGAHASAQVVLPPESAYVRVNEQGQLELEGVRVRFWGAVGKFPGTGFAGPNVDPYEVNEQTIRRLRGLGFNLIRLWGAPRPHEPYTKGDKSHNDIHDHFIHTAAQHGMKIWWAGFGGEVGNAMPADVDIIDDPATAEAWAEAVGERGWPLGKRSFANVWDPRMQAIRIRNLTALANHVNQWTGFRYADDPTIVVWELVNEDWWMFSMTRGTFLRLPDFFLRQLGDRWNQWLAERYGSDSSLRVAWAGNVLEGESLDRRSISLLPLPRATLNDAQAKSLGVNVDDPANPDIDMSIFSERRGRDVIEFLTSSWIQSKLNERDALKPLGRSLSLSPMIFDTGIGNDLPTQFMHAHADAVVHATYINGSMHPDSSHRRFPWFSALDELPKLAWDKPWLEQNRISGKPFFVYENNIMQPAKYRGEHPMRMAHLGSINDWDIVVFHYWGMPRDPANPAPFDAPMDYVTTSHYAQGYHFQFDQVLQSAITGAGAIFTQQLLAPAAEPTRFVIGGRSLYSPRMIEFGELLPRMLATTYRHGSRLEFDPSRPDDQIIGPSRRRGIYEPSPIRPTDQMTFDYQAGRLIFDAPAAVMFCGFLGADDSFAFRNGVRLERVSIQNDPGIAYPVADDEKYITLALVSADGSPLAQARTIRLTAESTSFNAGFEIDESKVTAEWVWPTGSIVSRGGPGVHFAKIDATLVSDHLRGMRYRVLDWHLRPIAEGTVEDGRFHLQPDTRWFMVEFERVQ